MNTFYFKQTVEFQRPDGLVALHAFTITKLSVIKYSGRDQKMIRFNILSLKLKID